MKKNTKFAYTTMDSPIGSIGLMADEFGVSDILFVHELDRLHGKKSPHHKLLQLAVQELSQYFELTRKEFSIPLSIQGTEFQQSVWQQVRMIPYGETRTYGEIAQQVNSPKASRAVGMANNKNRLPIIIPCHRVIGKDGSLTGYGGGLPIKSFLLQLEQKFK